MSGRNALQLYTQATQAYMLTMMAYFAIM